jgi:xanthine dehydrogenase accessory factor
MNDTEYLTKIICGLIDQGKPCVLAMIVENSGSTPRHKGSKMVIDAGGRIWGTIGGSLVEAAAIKQASYVITAARSTLMDFDLDNESVNSKGMICGGKASILLDYIAPVNENREFFQKWNDIIRSSRNFFFIASLKDIIGSSCTVGHNILFRDGTVLGKSFLQPGDFTGILKSELHNIPGTTRLELEKYSVIIDPISRARKLFCLGAGHVAKPTVHLAALVGFDVIVIDDRPEFANKERFPEASEIRVVEDYRRAYASSEIDSDTFIVILTRGHLFDRVSLEEALKTKAGYIGMMGSKKKRESIYAALKEKGFTEADIARVHSPIGLAIEAETPEELSVSITGELIKERAQQQK